MNTTCSTVLVSIYLDVSTCCEELKQIGQSAALGRAAVGRGTNVLDDFTQAATTTTIPQIIISYIVC